MSETYAHGEAEKRVLICLYAPYRIGDPESDRDTYIDGRTRIMKGVFLTEKKAQEELGAESSIPFIADKYGPFSKEVLQALDTLGNQGLIEVQERDDSKSADRYMLTDEGIDVARLYWEELSDEEQELFSWVKRRHIAQSLNRLLSFVYKRYPHMTSESEVREKYLAK